MKNIVYLFLFVFSPVVYAQCEDTPASLEEDSLSHLMNIFINLDLVVGPEIYNPERSKELEYVIFSQDTVFEKSIDRGTVYAVIDDSDSKEAYYCIGTIGNYVIRDFFVGIIMVRGFKDGHEEEVFLPMHFNEVPLPLFSDYEYATYGVDVELYWAYGDGVSN